MRTVFAAIVFLAVLPASAFHVMIDPGHGGVDTGAVHGGLKESDLVLRVAKKLRERLAGVPGIEVSLTRAADLALSLPERVRKSDTAGADLFISLHANSAPDEKARGLEFFFQNSLPADEDAQFLAKVENQSHGETDAAVDDSRAGDVNMIVEDLHRQSRQLASLNFSRALARRWSVDGKAPAIKQAPLYVVSRARTPSVLVEIGFLTHPTESRKLATDSYQNELADRLRDAVVDYRAQVAAPTPLPLR